MIISRLKLGSFEQDETPAATGIFPNNGITGKLTFANGSFEMVFDIPGRKGQLTPGKRALPGFYVYCVGLVTNSDEKQGSSSSSGPKPKGRGFGRSFGKVEKQLVGPVTTSDEMEVSSILNQDFEKFLQQNGYSGGNGTKKPTEPESFTTQITTISPLGAGKVVGSLYKSTTASNIFIPNNGTE